MVIDKGCMKNYEVLGYTPEMIAFLGYYISSQKYDFFLFFFYQPLSATVRSLESPPVFILRIILSYKSPAKEYGVYFQWH
jgi:hypothetical protein